MSEFENDNADKNTGKQNTNACSKALRLDIEQEYDRSLLSSNSISVITKAVSTSCDKFDAAQNDSKLNHFEPKRNLSSTNNDTRYALGVDFVITALLAVAGITKVRQEPQKEIAEKTEPAVVEYSMSSSSGYWPNHEQKRQTIIIGLNDCLNKIADTLYQDPNIGWLIADLNKHRMSERKDGKLRVVSIAALQILDMPNEEEIAKFKNSRSSEWCAENLVTIVLQNTIDKNKLEETLAPVVPKLSQDQS